MTSLISHSDAWKALQAHQQNLSTVHLRDLFDQDPARAQRYTLEACGLRLDYSKNHLTDETLKLLFTLAETAELSHWIEQMFSGAPINNTEQRATLHMALRNRSNSPMQIDGQDVMPDVNAVLDKMRAFTESVREACWKGCTGRPIEAIVNIGIGGSDQGPVMVCRALQNLSHPRLRAYFVSNVDSKHLAETLQCLNPETTLFIIASKSFSTQETMLNAHSARHWLTRRLGEEAVAHHFVALSTNVERVKAFGINPDNMFEFWDWVGGRYSLWSAIGLSIAILIGMDRFEHLLAGAYAMDTHFRTAAPKENMPVILGLLDVWYSSFSGTASRAILPYDFALEYFPAFLQQLMMESLGKSVTRDGIPVNYPTCPVVWGSTGNHGQHTFYQLLHQGTQMVPSDFLVAVEGQYSLAEHQDAVLCNALAQSHTLMAGQTAEQLQKSSDSGTVLSHLVYRGNQPSNLLLYQKLTPLTLGALIALYEHRVFVQSVCWQINAFDQWGVELGKQVASMLLPQLQGKQAISGTDSSTAGLLEYLIKQR